MLIYLLGYMGCGKTTAGKKLASKLGYKFIDLDHLIEEAQGTTIANIFAEQGEDTFRKIEHEMLASTFELNNAVISTGGGAPCFYNNIQAMNENGLTIYIEMTPKGLITRLKGNIEERPLLKGKSDDELFAFISGALEKRNPFYYQAKAIVDGISLSAESLIEAIETYKAKQN